MSAARRRAGRGLTIAAVVLAGVIAFAQQTDRARAVDEQIDRIFQAKTYEAPRFGPASTARSASFRRGATASG